MRGGYPLALPGPGGLARHCRVVLGGEAAFDLLRLRRGCLLLGLCATC